MENNSIDTAIVFDRLTDILEYSNKIKETYKNLETGFENISSSSHKLADCNQQLKSVNTIYSEETGQSSCTKEIWKITVPEEFIHASSIIHNNEFAEILDDFIGELTNSEAIVEFIETEINNLTNTLALTEGGIAAFEALRTNIFLDEYNAAKNTNNVTVSDEKVKYWTDDPLEFRYDSETGSYLILQGGVGMGWTNKDGILAYYKALKDSNHEEKVDEEKTVEEKVDEKEKNSNPEEIFDVDVPNSVRKEIMDYSFEATSITASKYEKQKAYNELSEMAKQIIDKEIVVVPKEIHHYVEVREDIIVPEGKILTGIGYRNALEGEVLKYDSDKGKYYSSSGGMGFSIENMSNGNLIDK